MIRVVLILLCCVSWVNAAPIPANAKAEEADKQRKKWISELINPYDPVKPIQAAMALIDDPGSLSMLKELCRPMTATKEEVERWLKELDSTDENDRAVAIKELVYFPPQEYFSAADLLKKCETQRSLQGLVAIIEGHANTNFDPAQRIVARQVQKVPGDQTIQFDITTTKQGATTGISYQVHFRKMLEQQLSRTHELATVAALILHRKNTDLAKAQLDAVLKGYADGVVTKAARELLDPKSKLLELPNTLASQWIALTEPKEEFGCHLRPLLILMNWVDHPPSMKELRTYMKPVEANKIEVREWFKDLDSADAKTKKNAHEKLGFHDPRLCFTAEELLKETEHSDLCKIRLYEIVSGVPQHDMANYYTNITVELREKTWTWSASPRAQPSKRITIDTQQLNPVKDIVNSAWAQQRIAIIALERIGTPEAIAMLKNLATGHPDALPTREAVAAVERLKEKK